MLGRWMRKLGALAVATAGVTGCATSLDIPAYSNCQVETEDVIATANLLTWRRTYVQPGEARWLGTYVSLNYWINLNPASANQRSFSGLSDHAQLYLHVLDQFRALDRASRIFSVELRANGRTIRRAVDEHASVSIQGPDLDQVLASDDDIEIFVLDSTDRIVRQDRVPRRDLRDAEREIRSALIELQRDLTDPDQYCEVVVVT